MKKLFYPAIFTEEKEGYSVCFPDLDGCFTEGRTIDEAYMMAFDAIGLYLQDEKGFKDINPSNPKDIKVNDNQFIILVEFDELKYLKKHGDNLVKKTLTIPEWLNTVAENLGINFSATLREALMEKIRL